MIKNLITAGAFTSGNIPSTTSAKTNSAYIFNNNAFEVTVGGVTEFDVNVVFEATSAGSISLQAYANGVAVPGAIASATVTSGDTYTLNLNDVVQTVLTNGDYASLSFTLSEPCTLVGGDIILKHEV